MNNVLMSQPKKHHESIGGCSRGMKKISEFALTSRGLQAAAALMQIRSGTLNTISTEKRDPLNSHSSCTSNVRTLPSKIDIMTPTIHHAMSLQTERATARLLLCLVVHTGSIPEICPLARADLPFRQIYSKNTPTEIE